MLLTIIDDDKKSMNGFIAKSIFAKWYDENGINNDLRRGIYPAKDKLIIQTESIEARKKLNNELIRTFLKQATESIEIPKLRNPIISFFTKEMIDESNSIEYMKKLQRWNKWSDHQIDWVSTEKQDQINRINISIDSVLRTKIEKKRK